MSEDNLDVFLNELEELLNKHNIVLYADYLEEWDYDDNGKPIRIGVDPYIIVGDSGKSGMYLSVSKLP